MEEKIKFYISINIKFLLYMIIQIYFFKIKIKYNEINLIKLLYNITNINLYINYINNCTHLIRFNNESFIRKEYPFLSICISAYNSENYIEKAVLSIINQSFRDFEIIIVNDYSIDHTYEILLKLQKQDERIKIINHSKNLGIYHSRAEGVLNSKSKYILFLDADDMIFNPFLFEKLYESYLNYNLDIIEYTVFYQIEKRNKIYCPKESEQNHYHNYSNKIIYQPELSNIIYFKPNSKEYSTVICRTIWSKIYKKNVILKAIKYIGDFYYNNENIIIAEDTLLNIVIFNFAKNYTNLNIPGYLYNIRKSSISHLNDENDYLRKKSISFFLYYFLFYRYIKDFDKDRNYLYYDLKAFGLYILNLEKYNSTKHYLKKAKIMFKEILNDYKATVEFKNYIKLNFKTILK
jgi:glycosyltransferase involved in cell wall biosynthesis